MSILSHALLRRLSNAIDKGTSPLRWIDLYAAQYVIDCLSTEAQETPAGSTDDLVALVVLTSYVSSQGRTYLDLSEHTNDTAAVSLLSASSSFSVGSLAASLLGFSLAPLTQLLQMCRVSPVVRVVEGLHCQQNQVPLDAEKGADAPLILWQERLYLGRYWHLYQKLEVWLRAQGNKDEILDKEQLEALSLKLKAVFELPISSERTGPEEVNWQAVAAAHTLLQSFSLITGGPGTGKTTTAASLLFLLMQKRQLQLSEKGLALSSIRPSVRLLAPTGKAAVKLADSIRQHLLAIENRLMGADIKSVRMSDCLPPAGETIHRFLYEHGGLRGALNQTKQFNSDEVLLGEKDGRRAQVDIIIIDESSMIDLALMIELIDIIPEHAQVIMLGDHFQLPPVEPGQVFAECVKRYVSQSCGVHFSRHLSQLTGYHIDDLHLEGQQALESENTTNPLCQLKKTYRFGGDLKTAADQIKSGDFLAFKAKFGASSSDLTASSVRWFNLQSVRDDAASVTQVYDSIIESYKNYFSCVSQRARLSELVNAFEIFQLLCSTHEGPLGVNYFNELVEAEFVYKTGGTIRNALGLYHGKVILVTRNHPHLGVFNGDIGFVLASEKAQSDFEIHFPSSISATSVSKKTLSDQATLPSSIVVAPGRLHEWQPAYAMTIHKSQGSEYQSVGIVLADYAKELLSRPLLYTGLTRSKASCDIWADSSALIRAFE